MVATITETYSYADHIFPNKKVEIIISKFFVVCLCVCVSVREWGAGRERERERGGVGGRELSIFAL